MKTAAAILAVGFTTDGCLTPITVQARRQDRLDFVLSGGSVLSRGELVPNLDFAR